MKKILILALILTAMAIKSYSQGYGNKVVFSDTLVAGADTLVVDTLDFRYSGIYATIEDTGATHTDSVAFESWDSKLRVWVRIGAVSMYDGTTVSVAAAANTIRMYRLLPAAGEIIRMRLINADYVAGRRVRTSYTLVNY